MVRFQGGVESPLLGNPMKKASLILGSAILSIGACAVVIWLSVVLGISAHFPSPGGEDDFSQRAAYFLFGVCPAFLLLGAWIGYTGFGHMRRWFAMWVGVFVGAVVVLAAAASLRGQIENLSEDGAANRAVLLFYGAWVASSTFGAVVARSLSPK